MPPEYERTSRSAASVRSNSSSSSDARRRAARRDIPNSLAIMSTCSRPVEYRARPASWSATPIDRRTASGAAETSWPATTARPDVGRSSVASMRIVVVLPAPFGPSSP